MSRTLLGEANRCLDDFMAAEDFLAEGKAKVALYNVVKEMATTEEQLKDLPVLVEAMDAVCKLRSEEVQILREKLQASVKRAADYFGRRRAFLNAIAKVIEDLDCAVIHTETHRFELRHCKPTLIFLGNWTAESLPPEWRELVNDVWKVRNHSALCSLIYQLDTKLKELKFQSPEWEEVRARRDQFRGVILTPCRTARMVSHV